MTEVLLTIMVFGFTVLIVILALKGDAVIWKFPPYRRFKNLVRNIEQAMITRVKGSNPPEPVSVRMMGRRRVPEIFALGDSRADGVTITDCFGAIYLKDESIDDALTLIQINAWVFFGVSLFGMLFIIFFDPQGKDQLLASGFWEIAPTAAGLLLSHHLILIAELVVIASSLLYLFHIARLLRKLNRLFDAVGD
jgi:hypothetical protein